MWKEQVETTAISPDRVLVVPHFFGAIAGGQRLNSTAAAQLISFLEHPDVSTTINDMDFDKSPISIGPDTTSIWGTLRFFIKQEKKEHEHEVGFLILNSQLFDQLKGQLVVFLEQILEKELFPLAAKLSAMPQLFQLLDPSFKIFSLALDCLEKGEPVVLLFGERALEWYRAMEHNKGGLYLNIMGLEPVH